MGTVVTLRLLLRHQVCLRKHASHLQNTILRKSRHCAKAQFVPLTCVCFKARAHENVQCPFLIFVAHLALGIIVLIPVDMHVKMVPVRIRWSPIGPRSSVLRLNLRISRPCTCSLNRADLARVRVNSKVRFLLGLEGFKPSQQTTQYVLTLHCHLSFKSIKKESAPFLFFYTQASWLHIYERFLGDLNLEAYIMYNVWW